MAETRFDVGMTWSVEILRGLSCMVLLSVRIFWLRPAVKYNLSENPSSVKISISSLTSLS